MTQIVTSVKCVMDLQNIMDEKLKGTIIQYEEGSVAEMAIGFIEQFYRPTSRRAMKRVFSLVTSDSDVKNEVENVLTREARKRQRGMCVCTPGEGNERL